MSEDIESVYRQWCAFKSDPNFHMYESIAGGKPTFRGMDIATLEAYGAKSQQQSLNPRDTHFAGFAEKLLENLPWRYINVDFELDGWEERWKTVIAQHAYDLVHHTLEHVEHINLDRDTVEEHVLKIPDLTVWPEEQQKLEQVSPLALPKKSGKRYRV